MGQSHGILNSRSTPLSTRIIPMNITEVEYDLDDDIHYCHRCDICFVSDMHLQSHLRTSTAHNPIYPTNSLQASNAMIVDDVDSREAIGLDDLYCMECDQLCLSRGEMERHMENVHAGTSSQTVASLAIEDRNERCQVCKKQFVCGLNNHLRYATLHRGRGQAFDYNWDEESRRLNKCKVCDIRLGSLEALRRHFRDVNYHNIRVAPLINSEPSQEEGDYEQVTESESFAYCAACNRYFSDMEELQAHRQSPLSQRECRGIPTLRSPISIANINASTTTISSPIPLQPYESGRNRSRVLRKSAFIRGRAIGELRPTPTSIDLLSEFPTLEVSERYKHSNKKGKGKLKELGNFGIKGLGSAANKNTEKVLDCPLCLEKRNNLSSLSCGHVFCTPCIHEALRVNGRCPICRRTAQRSDLRRIFLT